MHNLLLAVASALRVGHRQCPHKATCRSIPNSCGQNQHGPCPQGPLNMEGVGRVTEAASLTVEKTWKFPWLCPALPSLHPFPGSSHRFQVPCSPSKPEVPISVLRSHWLTTLYHQEAALKCYAKEKTFIWSAFDNWLGCRALPLADGSPRCIFLLEFGISGQHWGLPSVPADILSRVPFSRTAREELASSVFLGMATTVSWPRPSMVWWCGTCTPAERKPPRCLPSGLLPSH